MRNKEGKKEKKKGRKKKKENPSLTKGNTWPVSSLSAWLLTDPFCFVFFAPPCHVTVVVLLCMLTSLCGTNKRIKIN